MPQDSGRCYQRKAPAGDLGQGEIQVEDFFPRLCYFATSCPLLPKTLLLTATLPQAILSGFQELSLSSPSELGVVMVPGAAVIPLAPSLLAPPLTHTFTEVPLLSCHSPGLSAPSLLAKTLTERHPHQDLGQDPVSKSISMSAVHHEYTHHEQ